MNEISELKKQLTKDNDVFKTNIDVLKTNNYSLFRFSGLNREPKHAKKIVDSINNNDLTMFNPILVTFTEEGYLLIIDGQNRYLACKELGIPIYFILSEEADIDDAPNLNSASKNWSIEDYIRHYARRGNENYIFLLNLKDKYNAPITSILRFCTNQFNPGYHIKSGTLKINEHRDYDSFLRHWKDIADNYYPEFGYQTLFVDALAQCYFNGKYNESVMEEKLAFCSRILNRQSTREGYKLEIEKVYNYKASGKNKIKF